MAALDYLRFADHLRSPRPHSFDGMPTGESRPLTKTEQAVYDAALVVLLHYFTGERNFNDSASDDEDDQNPPSNVQNPVSP